MQISIINTEWMLHGSKSEQYDKVLLNEFCIRTTEDCYYVDSFGSRLSDEFQTDEWWKNAGCRYY